MALNDFFTRFPKVLNIFRNRYGQYKFLDWRYFFYFFLVLLLFSIFMFISNLINQKNELEKQNLNSLVKSKEFSLLNDYLISKINNPYKEVQYLIQNNDSVEKILKKLEINANDIKIISNNLKQKKLTNIYAGRTLSLVLKKLEDGSNTLVNLTYPINNTLNIEIRKSQNNFIVKENILKLYKKEVVIKNEIKSSLYNAAVKSGIEPNIIIEFA